MSKLVELDDKNHEGFKNMALEARKKVKENKNIEKQKSTEQTVENVSLSTTGGESESLKDSKSHDLVHDKGGKLTMLQTETIIEPEKKKEKEKEKEKEKGKEEGKEKEKEKKKDKNGEKGNKKDKEKKEKKKKKNTNVETTSSSSSSSESDEDIGDKKNKSNIPWHEYLQLPTSKPWIWLGVLGMSLLVLVGGAAKMMKKPRDEEHAKANKRMISSSADDQLQLCPSCYHNHKNALVKKS